MLDYFAPKTKHVELVSGVGSHKSSRGGSFVVDLVNNQYNSHHFWAYTGIDEKTGKYLCGLYNNVIENNPWIVTPSKVSKVEFRREGFDTEQEAANALDAFAASLGACFLREKLKTHRAEQETLEKALADYERDASPDQASKV